MNKPGNIALDAGIAAALLVALLIVYLVDVSPAAPSMNKDEFKVIRPESVASKPLRLAVTPKSFDDIGSLLTQLGKGYEYTNIQNIDLRDLDRLKDFDVLFVTCATSTSQDIHQNEALRRFVEQGGTIYASDWRLDCIVGAFPEYIDRSAMKWGQRTELRARVLDKGLREALGPEVAKEGTVHLGFELPGWKPAAFDRNKVTVYMEGDYPSENAGLVKNAPLLVKFSCKKGTVIFTSFHNAKQDKVADKLLRHLVFHAVNARAEAELRAKLEEKGFTPTTSSLVSAPEQNASVTKTFLNKKAGPLVFTLAFNPRDNVKLRLQVKRPDGKVAHYEDTSGFGLEFSNAQPGEWEYTVTAINLNDPNFPFSVSVAQPK